MEYDNEPTLHDLIKLLRRGLLVALLAGVAAGALAYFVSRAAPPTFEAQATVVSSAQDPNQRDFGTTLVTAPPLATTSYIVAINSRPVVTAALEAISGRAPTSLEVDAFDTALAIRSEGTLASSLIRILVRDPEPARARDLANALASAAVQWDEQRATRSLEVIIESLQAQIASIETELESTVDAPAEGLERARAELALQLSSARALRSGAVGRLELLEAAVEPRAPVSPRPTRNAVLAALFGIFAAYGLVLLQNALDTRLRGPDDLARTTGLPLLAEFPKVAGGRRKLPREAASYLRTAVSFATSDADPKVLLVTSTGSAHGKSSVSMAMAESFARQHYRVLLVDADLRRPVLGTEYLLDPLLTPTIQTALDEPGRARPITVALGRELTLDVFPGFVAVPNPTELLANNVRELLNHVAPDYDVIVIDCAPVLPVADALTVAPYTSGVVFVVSVPDTDRKDVVAAIELLRRVGVRILGTVATNLPKERHGRGNKGYGYEYGAEVPEVVASSSGAKSRRSPALRSPAPADEGADSPKRSASSVAERGAGHPTPRGPEKVASGEPVPDLESTPTELVVTSDYPRFEGPADVHATIELLFPRVLGGQEPYAFELTAGALPPPYTTRSVGEGRGEHHTGGTFAIALGPDGALRGATGWPGRYTGTVTVTDANGHTGSAGFEFDLALSLSYLGELEMRVPAEPAVVVHGDRVRVSGVPIPALPATGMELYFELSLDPAASRGTPVRAPEEGDFAISRTHGTVSMMRASPGRDVLRWSYRVVAHRAERDGGVLVPLKGGRSSAPVTLVFVRP